MTPPSPPTPTPPQHAPDGPSYPGGEDNPAYRRAFNAFALLFLLTLSFGLLNFLGSYLKAQMAP